SNQGVWPWAAVPNNRAGLKAVATTRYRNRMDRLRIDWSCDPEQAGPRRQSTRDDRPLVCAQCVRPQSHESIEHNAFRRARKPGLIVARRSDRHAMPREASHADHMRARLCLEMLDHTLSRRPCMARRLADRAMSANPIAPTRATTSIRRSEPPWLQPAPTTV